MTEAWKGKPEAEDEKKGFVFIKLITGIREHALGWQIYKPML